MSIRDIAPWRESNDSDEKEVMKNPMAQIHREVDRIFDRFSKGVLTVNLPKAKKKTKKVEVKAA